MPLSLTQPKYRVTWKTLLLPLVGLAAFFAYIYVFSSDIPAIISNVQNINFYYYSLATVAVILDTLFFTLAWNTLLKFLSVKISIFKSFLFVWVGVFVDTLIPAESVSGEITKIYLVNKEQNGTTGKATASVVAHRLIGMGLTLGSLLVGAVLLLIEGGLNMPVLQLNMTILQFTITMLVLIIVIVALMVFFLVLLLLLCVKQCWTLRIIDALIRFAERITRGRWQLLLKLREELVETAAAFHGAIKEYAHAPKTLLVSGLLSAVSLMFSLSVFYLVCLSIPNIRISWSAILIVSMIFAAIKSVPVGIPFEVGVPEITLTGLLQLFNYTVIEAASITILMRILTLWLRFFIGFAAEQWMGIKAITTGPSDIVNPPLQIEKV